MWSAGGAFMSGVEERGNGDLFCVRCARIWTMVKQFRFSVWSAIWTMEHATTMRPTPTNAHSYNSPGNTGGDDDDVDDERSDEMK